jgi:serine/threonine protein kinase
MQRLSQKNDRYPSYFALEGVTVTENDPLAVGRVADVYKGTLKDRAVCLKMIKVLDLKDIVKVCSFEAVSCQLCLDERLIQQFAHEAILWGQLSHPNILPFYGFVRFRSRICLVSPWFHNGHVNQYLERNPNADRTLLVSVASLFLAVDLVLLKATMTSR